MEFQSNKLYPVPKVQSKNMKYAKLLLKNYAGNTSEDTAVHLYTFQNMILSNGYPQIANDLFHISVVEMHHLKLLGKTISLLGMSPEFITYNSDNKQYWSSKNVDYITSLKDILNLNIKQEQTAIQQYLEHYEIIKDPYIRNLLKRIIEDEKIHLEYFQKQLSILK